MKHKRSINSFYLTAIGSLIGVGVAASIVLRKHAQQTSPLIRERANLTALVTGASSGIGASYARCLASMGYDVILVARREQRLLALAQALQAEYQVHANIQVADLATEQGIACVEQLITETPELMMLVNNAGFGVPGEFMANSIERQLDMVQVHVNATVRLTRAVLPAMLEQQRGAIVNVSSISAFYPLAGGVTYSATKSYLNAFTESLHQELMGTGVRIQALCPGFTKSGFMEASGQSLTGLPEFAWCTPELVVERSLRDLDNHKVISVPGVGYALFVQLSRWLPRPLLYIMGRQVAVLRKRGYHIVK